MKNMEVKREKENRNIPNVKYFLQLLTISTVCSPAGHIKLRDGYVEGVKRDKLHYGTATAKKDKMMK